MMCYSQARDCVTGLVVVKEGEFDCSEPKGDLRFKEGQSTISKIELEPKTR